MLTQEIAKDIVEQMTIRLNRNINIMDSTGTIIASADPSRINQVHDGAIEVLQTGHTLVIYPEERSKWNRSLPGINLPIEFQNDIVGVIGITGAPEEIREFGELVKMNTEIMLRQAYLMEQLEWKQRLKDQIFESLIRDSYDLKTIQQKLELIEMTIKPPYQVALLDVSSSLKRSQLMDIFEQVFSFHKTFIGFLGMNQIYILTTGSQTEIVQKKLTKIIDNFYLKKLTARVGSGSSVSSLDEIKLSFQEAVHALTLGESEKTFISYTDIKTKALIYQVDKETKKRYYESILNNLSEKLIDTLEHFFQSNLNIGDCAKSMYIHRNSLIYRLNKVKEITGYNPRELKDVLPLQLAIWLRQME
ncbi:CdaR family transcriptional regulator [Halalkalibacterium ligniniphilum]|uniref:CdaR family transcriptional regulator n=1 Tax=Halalkalibacterium ligniniphilum TaxID=1134413 RepID=UPI00034512EA|nr:sugar diacid recognition domain-containing protein [Halalkalibacterium ligniniphilum]